MSYEAMKTVKKYEGAHLIFSVPGVGGGYSYSNVYKFIGVKGEVYYYYLPPSYAPT